MDTIATHWFWLSSGLILGIAEMVFPRRFLLWLGLTAIVVGLLDWAFPISIPLQVALFAILSVLSVSAGKKIVKAKP